jgi:hypothetical protein
MAEFVSTHHIDYLQRQRQGPPALPEQADTGSVAPGLRRLMHIVGVGRLRSKTPAAARGSAAAEVSGQRDAAQLHEDLAIGLYGYKIPLVYIVWGRPEGVGVHLGTWAYRAPEMAAAQAEIVTALMRGLFPAPLVGADPPHLEGLDQGGLVLGIPTTKPAATGDETLPWDRVIRAMSGARWAAVILAQPIHQDVASDLRHQVLNEMRAVASMQQSERAPSPLAEHYHELLQTRLASFGHGLAVGTWRTAVYLLGDDSSYYRLSSVWRAAFAGTESQQEPVVVWDHDQAPGWAAQWALPDYAAVEGPGRYRHPFQYQTLLTSSQLASYVHLPGQETPGFQISTVPDFDVVPPERAGRDSLHVGQVLHQMQDTETPYALSPDSLGRHMLIAGITGGGKTNTVFHLLRQLWRQEVPFLVLEPAKTEYRALLGDEALRPHLRVYTLGDETIAPFRLNPLEIQEGVAVATHIDLLRAVFDASFGMWTPLPQVLERCLHAVYADFGWDPVGGGNERLGEGDPIAARAAAMPTLTDLYEKADEVVEQLGYEARVTSDLRAALLTRLNSLRIGGKGAMLDTRRSLPIEMLLAHPTIIELEQIGNDDEKAFLMGLLLVRLYEHLRVHGHVEGRGLQHLVVVEEAHRLLTNVSPERDPEQGNAKGKAVETFVNMLSEVRAYGEAFCVAEQIPTKLAPDVIKNTSVKLVHRMVAADDREILRYTMNMDAEQSEALATLRVGQAAAFAEGDDRPVLLQVPYAKIEAPPEMSGRRASDEVVAEQMRPILRQPELAPCYALFDFYPQAPASLRRFDDEAKAIIARREVQDAVAAYGLRLALADDGLLDHTQALVDLLRAHLRPGPWASDALRAVMLHGVRWYLTTFGRHYHWPYDTLAVLQEEMASVSTAALSAIVGDGDGAAGVYQRLERLQASYIGACRRYYDPFEVCSTVCPSGHCLFRYHSRRLLRDQRLRKLFDGELSRSAKERVWPQSAALRAIGRALLGSNASAGLQQTAGLCYGIQRIAEHPDLLENGRAAATRAWLLQSAGV